MNWFGQNQYFFNNKVNYLDENKLIDRYDNKNFCPTTFSRQMIDNVWCHDVPQNMHKAFNVQNNQTDINSQSLVRFSAPQINNFQSHLSNNYWKTISDLSTAPNNMTPFKNYKRKIFELEDDINEEQRPTKQNATEEKIMAKFNNLKLVEKCETNNLDEICHDLMVEDFNNNFNNNLQNIEEDIEFNDECLDYDEIEINEDDEINKTKIMIFDEVKDILDSNNDVITKLYKQEQMKKSKALVLWKPMPNLFKNENKSNKTRSNIIDQTEDYIVEEILDENLDENLEESEKSSVVITEINFNDELDLDKNNTMMEM